MSAVSKKWGDRRVQKDLSKARMEKYLLPVFIFLGIKYYKVIENGCGTVFMARGGGAVKSRWWGYGGSSPMLICCCQGYC